MTNLKTFQVTSKLANKLNAKLSNPGKVSSFIVEEWCKCTGND